MTDHKKIPRYFEASIFPSMSYDDGQPPSNEELERLFGEITDHLADVEGVDVSLNLDKRYITVNITLPERRYQWSEAEQDALEDLGHTLYGRMSYLERKSLFEVMRKQGWRLTGERE